MPGAGRSVRLAYLATHPIQYQAPLLRRIAQEPGIDLTAKYAKFTTFPAQELIYTPPRRKLF